MRKGFSLVELLLFTGIVALMAGTLVGVSIVSSDISSRSETRSEVEQNGSLLMQRLIQEIGNSDYIVYPPQGQSASIIILSGLDHDPNREVFIDLHHDTVRMVEGGIETTLITTEDVGVTQLVFFNNTSITEGGTVSAVFQIQNKSVGTEVLEGSYNKNFRGTASVLPYRCISDEDCTGQTCCDGICRDACLTGCTPGSCDAGYECCITDNAAGISACVAEGTCSDAECEFVNDCPLTLPYFLVDGVVLFCDLSTCEYKVPVCTDDNLCEAISVGKCDVCSECGDGWKDEAAGEECDDGNVDNSDDCTNACKLAMCGDHIIKEDGIVVCGDGDIEGAEECDDGNTDDGDGCSSTCTNEVVCSTPPVSQETPEASCHDALDNDCDGDTDCNDSNCDSDPLCAACTTPLVNREYPEASCNDTLDNDCDGLDDCNDDIDCYPSGFCSDNCGDGDLQWYEECDDWNEDSGDGCSANCEDEGSCESCWGSTCATSAKKWQVTFNTVVNGTCGECTSLNGTIELLKGVSEDHCATCAYCWAGTEFCGTDTLYMSWDGNDWILLYYDADDSGDPDQPLYSGDGSTWDCNGPNTMDWIDTTEHSSCSGWPAQITVTPMGEMECVDYWP